MSLRPTLAAHLAIARFDHWVKNVFILPGTAVALAADPGQLPHLSPVTLLAGLAAAGLAASSNYILNEILDAPFDRLHPLRNSRPAALGLVHRPLAFAQWILFFLAALALGSTVSLNFTLSLAALWFMGCLYNIPPIRAKDIAFVDVPVEAINNPIRFLLGWYLVPTAAVPIASVLISYWMAGCYFMAIKRYAECRDLRSAAALTQYRPCFACYNERNLLVSIVFYGLMSMLFFGAYIGRYRLEMALAFPFVALVMVIYFALAFKPDSAAQHPEALLREWPLMASIAVCTAVMAVLLYVDIPRLHEWFTPTRFSR